MSLSWGKYCRRLKAATRGTLSILLTTIKPSSSLPRGTESAPLKPKTAFGISVTRNGNQTFRLPLEPGEVEALKRLIYKYFDILFQNREFQADDNTADGHRPSPQKSSPPKTKPAPPAEEEDDDAPF